MQLVTSASKPTAEETQKAKGERNIGTKAKTKASTKATEPTKRRKKEENEAKPNAGKLVLPRRFSSSGEAYILWQVSA